MRFTAPQLEFLARLGRTAEGQQLRALITERTEDANRNLRSLEGVALHREQGRATELDEIAKYLNPSK